MYIEVIAIQTTNCEHDAWINAMASTDQGGVVIVAARVFDIWQCPKLAFLVLAPIWVLHCAIDFGIVTQNAVLQARTFVGL